MVEIVTARAKAGKTHYGKERVKELLASGIAAAKVDGDEYRQETGNQDFSDEGRLRNLMDAAKFAAEMEKKGIYVVMTFIAPKREWRQMMREMFQVSRTIYLPGGEMWSKSHPGYIEYEEPNEDEYGVFYNVNCIGNHGKNNSD